MDVLNHILIVLGWKEWLRIMGSKRSKILDLLLRQKDPIHP
jgi:hypothetical protein